MLSDDTQERFGRRRVIEQILISDNIVSIAVGRRSFYGMIVFGVRGLIRGD